MKQVYPLCLAATVLALAATSAAQGTNELLARMLEDHQDVVNAVVLYPEDVLDSILISATRPEALVQLDWLREQSSQAFRDFISPLPRTEQAQLFELARHPTLVAATVAGDLSAVVAEAETRALIATYAEDHPDRLARLHELNVTAEMAFEQFLRSYPGEVQQALRTLIAVPEALTLLTDNMDLAVLVGDAYRRNAEGVRARARALGLEAAQRNAEAVATWSESLEADPDLQADLEAAVTDFIAENGVASPQMQPTQESQEVTVNITYAPYPYWYGYPYWYTGPYWYPYPSWYYSGFYYGPNRTVVVVGLPSYHYTQWHFAHTYHHPYYPRLSDHYLRHWERHRDAHTGFNEAVGGWVDENRSRFGSDWLRDDGGRAQRFEEYGRFEQAFEQYNRQNLGNAMNREEFLGANTDRFSGLRSDATQRAPLSTESVSRARRAITEPSRDAAAQGRRPTERPTSVRGAADYHRGAWQRSGAGGGRRGRGRR